MKKKKKWVEIDKVIYATEIPYNLKEFDKIMKCKPNFDKKERGDEKNMSVKKHQDL